MRKHVLGVTAAIACLTLATSAGAQEPNYARRPVNNHAGTVNSPLSLPSTASPAAIGARFLRDRGLDVAENSLVRTGEPVAAANGVTVVRFEQRAAGLPVYGRTPGPPLASAASSYT